ncbi:hypothetical protein PVMG_00201 [Plasmodium vivax Mauritania I]|uniref:Uncharacterized protein n=1 Tax=Plasmodium vivax Mauritania I TaxID=1035515 RepID=A0A0J9T9N4_PLAVI|nr:hypothetical protein PVMG_00201 [Plasmodium vivax Mauritania I]
MKYKAAVCISTVLLLLQCQTAKTRSTKISANNQFNAAIGSLKKEFEYLNIKNETGADTTWFKLPKGFEFLQGKIEQEGDAHMSTEEGLTVKNEKIENNAEASLGSINVNIPQWGNDLNKFRQKKRLSRMLAAKAKGQQKGPAPLRGKPGGVFMSPMMPAAPMGSMLGLNGKFSPGMKPAMPWSPPGASPWYKGKPSTLPLSPGAKPKQTPRSPWAPLPQKKTKGDGKSDNGSVKSGDDGEEEDGATGIGGNGGLFGEYDQLLGGIGAGNPLLQGFLSAASGAGAAGAAGAAGLANAALGMNRNMAPRQGLPWGGRTDFFKGRLQYSSKGIKRTGWGKFCYFFKNLLCCLFIFATRTPLLAGGLGGVLDNPMVGSVIDLVQSGMLGTPY